MKKAVKIVLVIFATIVISVGIYIGQYIYKTEYRLTDKGEELSPDGKYAVLFQMVGVPDWPFGATTVRVTVYNTENDEKIKVIQDDIHDDGAVLRDCNRNVSWEEDSVIITLMGSEQEDEVYDITLK